MTPTNPPARATDPLNAAVEAMARELIARMEQWHGVGPSYDEAEDYAHAVLAALHALPPTDRAALAAALWPEQGWQPIETAVSGPIVGLTAGGRVVKMERGAVEGEDGTVGAWVALETDQHPPCWDDGYCWASNADGVPSDPPVLWTRLPALPAPPEPTP